MSWRLCFSLMFLKEFLKIWYYLSSVDSSVKSSGPGLFFVGFKKNVSVSAYYRFIHIFSFLYQFQ